MRKVIDLDKLNELLKEYKDFKLKDESFSEFVENTKDDDIPVWDWVDSVGVVTPEDFEMYFSKDYIKKNFKELANLWFKALSAQIDFSIVLENVRDEMKGE